MARLTLSISGMHCSHCSGKVEAALQSVAGTRGASVLLSEGEAEVDYDETRAKPEQYVTAVQSAGYAAQVAA